MDSSTITISVFRKGNWIHYTRPLYTDAIWSKCHAFQAASFYATALSQGVPSDESGWLAEIYVQKQICPETYYSQAIEKKLKQIMDHAERA
jgi:hypothetical protein